MNRMKLPDKFGQWQETLEDFLSETLLQIQQNCHGPLSFTEQNEENAMNNALETLALFLEKIELQIPEVRIEPKQTEYPVYHPYTDSVANLGDFDDTHSYIDDLGSEISHYSTTSGPNTPPQLPTTSLQAKDVEINHLILQLNIKKKKSQH